MMPRILLFLFLIVLASCKQNPPTEMKEPVIFHPFGLDSLNKVELKEVGNNSRDSVSIKKLSVNGFMIGDVISENQLASKFGKSDSIVTHLDEMERNEPVYIFYYKKSQLTIENNKFVDFEISDEMFYFDKVNIHIGDSIGKIGRMFPKSFNSLDPETIEVGFTKTNKK